MSKFLIRCDFGRRAGLNNFTQVEDHTRAGNPKRDSGILLHEKYSQSAIPRHPRNKFKDLGNDQWGQAE
jgi:hypothetical protein